MRLADRKGRAPTRSRIGLGLCLKVSLLGGCVITPPGDRLCVDPPACDCPRAADHGAVVVRWRISDAQAGQLLGRGECCCMPDDAPPSVISGQQCSRFGINCPTSPAWLIRNVQLRVTPVDGGPTCIISKPCTDAELTTEYCLAPGDYDLQVTADIEELYKPCGPDQSTAEFVCANRPAISPPSVRRTIIGGRTVNLDGIVLGVNPPPTTMPKNDGGTTGPDAGCSAPADGGAHD